MHEVQSKEANPFPGENQIPGVQSWMGTALHEKRGLPPAQDCGRGLAWQSGAQDGVAGRCVYAPAAALKQLCRKDGLNSASKKIQLL